MLNFHLSYQWLRWTAPSGPLPQLPEGVERFFVETKDGPIEVLYAGPNKDAAKGAAPIVFCHGGMGGAFVWLEYMQYLAAKGVPCYALSLRGHGRSWHPSYFRLLFWTSRWQYGDDLAAAIKFAQDREGSEVVLAGHSSGGGLSQALLSERNIHVKGLALLGAVPGFGS
jgi:pimeloyl-ACP methyl ester carboxylesterase